MRQYKVIDINDIKPEKYASFGIALMVMRMHSWECRSIIDGKLKMTRLTEDETDDSFKNDNNTFNNLS